MVSTAERATFRRTRTSRIVAGGRVAFDNGGTWMGTVSSCGAVFDADVVQIGVAWADGRVYDFHGTQVGRV